MAHNEFEKGLLEDGCKYGVAINSGTITLHTTLAALNRDHLTFIASRNVAN